MRPLIFINGVPINSYRATRHLRDIAESVDVEYEEVEPIENINDEKVERNLSTAQSESTICKK